MTVYVTIRDNENLTFEEVNKVEFKNGFVEIQTLSQLFYINTVDIILIQEIK